MGLEILSVVKGILTGISLLGFAVLALLYVGWAVSDARRRGKSAFLVVIAVTFFFPFGLIAWLLFGPPAPQAPRWVRRSMPSS